MIVPDSTSRVRRFRISRYSIVALFSFLFVLFATVALVSVYYYHIRMELVEGENLKKENVRLRNELVFIHEKVVSAQAIIDRVQRFDTKLRTITQLHDPKRHLGLGPFDIQKPTEIDGSEPGVIDPVILEIAEKPQLAIGLLGKRLDELTAEAQRREGSIRQLETYLRGQKVRLASTPSVWPSRGWLTSTFGMRIDPYTGKSTMHRGIDIANQEGVPIIAPASGVATFAGNSGGYGKVVVIDHGYGIRTRYAHLSEIALSIGDRVDRGDRIGRLGNSGRSTGPHLHYEIEVNGVNENPMNYILED